MKAILFVLFSLYFVSYPQTHRVISSNTHSIKIEFDFTDKYLFNQVEVSGKKFLKINGEGINFREPGQPWLPEYVVNIAVPFNSNPSMDLVRVDQQKKENVLILPYPKEDPANTPISLEDLDQTIYTTSQYFPNFVCNLGSEFNFRYARIFPVRVSPFQYNPVTRELIINNKVIIQITYNERSGNQLIIKDSFTRDFLYNTVLNPKQGEQWMSKITNASVQYDSLWYNPNNNYYKLFVKEKGVYRITYEYLQNAGVPLAGGVSSNKLELINNGNDIPIDIFDGQDQIFGPGDYFQFIGYPPDTTTYCKQNIYNTSNIYWFSYENDSSALTYSNADGFPIYWENTYASFPKILHFEKDSLYERLGYAGDDRRDFWFWGKAATQNNQITSAFQFSFNAPPELNIDSSVTIRIDMHGMTNNPYCNPEHKALIELTGNKIGSEVWDGQTRWQYTHSFFVSHDSITIGEDSIIFYPEGNYFRVSVLGDSCTNGSDEIRINWLEIQYNRNNAVDSNYFNFTSPQSYSGINRFWLYRWTKENMTIYIPAKNKKISNPQILNDQYRSVFFVDTLNQETEYFCASDDFFLVPDSLIKDEPSNLSSPNNGCDYIIIAHRKFSSIAEDLKSFREQNFPDTTISDPRIKICYIDDIYDEFSGGLLDPFAVQRFLKYAFENWQAPAPSYVVLIGDMSYDYRHLLSTSRENYIPSIPYYTNQYGLAASDNMFAAVSGSDVVPEMVLARFSIETVEEGNILLDKVKSYPSDYTKDWKQNVLLISSGLSAEDETFFGFNNASVKLEDLYLTPNGIKATKIMRYPNVPQYQQYEGGGPEIRNAINEGAVLVNYYGHGGGYQWDLTFLNDDIYLLENGGRLPFISSVTCYTAHFDNQDVFGEQFIKVPGKGAIAFFGSSGLTLWGIGTYINEVLFDEIFAKRHYIAGKAILNAKTLVGSSSFYNSQIALLTLLGEPLLKLCIPDKPDFRVTSSDISVSPPSPIVGDTALIKISLYNVGVTFPDDSVSVQLYATSTDTSYLIYDGSRLNFGETDSILVPWIPTYGGLYNLKLVVNEKNVIPEMDYSDNSIEVPYVVYDLQAPNIVSPIDGAKLDNKIDFLFCDIGHYLDLILKYTIEIDSSDNFENPISQEVLPADGILSWQSPTIPAGKYFWRTRVFDGSKYGGWSSVRTLTISDSSFAGYFASGKNFKLFNTYNVNYTPEGLQLNTNLLPPHPSNKRFINDLNIDLASVDSTNFTAITSDGKYIYLGNEQYWCRDSVNTNGSSYIYKIGTGFNGTIEGKFYGTVPNYYGPIVNQIFYHSDGYIYVAYGDPYKLKRVNPETGDTSSISIPAGIINMESSRVDTGSQYITSDGQFVYNLSIYDTLGNNKYTLRTLDPSNGWNIVRPDYQLSGTSFEPGFSGFFVAKGYIYPAERYWGGHMRRIRIQDGFFEEEWLTSEPFQFSYAWNYDWINDLVYTTAFKSSEYIAKVSKYQGTYIDAQGTITSPNIGPASKWISASYNIENMTTNGTYKVILLGMNSETKFLDTLGVGIPPVLDLGYIPDRYTTLQLNVVFIDSSMTTSNPLSLKELRVNYLPPPEVVFTKSNFIILPDTILQGFNMQLDFKAENIGKVTADSLKLDFYLDENDSTFYSQLLTLLPDSTVPIQTQTISTVPLAPATLHKIKAVGVLNKPEYFTFNNILSKGFYVARDSIKPDLSVTIDGKEIINGDVVSSKPDILITLKDESPLPLDTTLFTVVYNNIPLNFSRPDVHFESSPWPDNQFRIRWNPELPDGRHVLEVLAKDPSGNFSDTIARRIVFYIVNSFDLVEVYNYPNPFSDETYFTFQLYGDNSKLEEFKIKVYTVAGRMIREFDIPPDQLRAGFNKLPWDGKDQDGDPIANGVYLYKVITKNNGETKTKIQKLAKVK